VTSFTSLFRACLIWTLTALLLVSCAPAKADHMFAIYLPDPMISVEQMTGVNLSTLPLQEEPLIAARDIISYNLTDHEMALNEDALTRLQQLQAPLNGLPFVVCADNKPVYWGAFWTPLSSLSFDGPVILLPLLSESRQVKIQWGYPGSPHPPGRDPRASPEILRSLQLLGKLKRQQVNLPVVQ